MVNFIQGLKKYAKSSQDAETKRHSISPIRIREKHDDKHNKRASLCGGALQFSRGASAADIQDSLDDRSKIKASLVDNKLEFEDEDLQAGFRDVVEAAAQAEAVLDAQSDFLDVADMDLHEQRRHLLQSTVDIFSTIVNQVNGLVAQGASVPVMSGLVPCGVQTSPRQAGSPLLKQAEVMRQEESPSYIKQKIVRTVNEAVAGFGPFPHAESYLDMKARARSRSPEKRTENALYTPGNFPVQKAKEKSEYLSSTTNKYPTTVDEAREFFYSRAGVTPEALQRAKNEDLAAPQFPTWKTHDRIAKSTKMFGGRLAHETVPQFNPTETLPHRISESEPMISG